MLLIGLNFGQPNSWWFTCRYSIMILRKTFWSTFGFVFWAEKHMQLGFGHWKISGEWATHPSIYWFQRQTYLTLFNFFFSDSAALFCLLFQWLSNSISSSWVIVASWPNVVIKHRGVPRSNWIVVNIHFCNFLYLLIDFFIAYPFSPNLTWYATLA